MLSGLRIFDPRIQSYRELVTPTLVHMAPFHYLPIESSRKKTNLGIDHVFCFLTGNRYPFYANGDGRR